MAEENSKPSSQDSKPEAFVLTLRLDPKFRKSKSPFFDLIKDDFTLPSPAALFIVSAKGDDELTKIRLALEDDNRLSFSTQEPVWFASLVCSKVNMSTSQKCAVHMSVEETNLVIRILPHTKAVAEKLRENFDLFEGSMPQCTSSSENQKG